MTPDDRIHDEKREREMSEQDDPTLTTRVRRTGSAEEESKPVETSPAEAPADIDRHRATDLASNQGRTQPAQTG